MKISIKTKDLELTYEDEYSKIDADAKDRIKDLLKMIFEHRIVDQNTIPNNQPFVGFTVEKFYNETDKTNKL